MQRLGLSWHGCKRVEHGDCKDLDRHDEVVLFVIGEPSHWGSD
jgi:hypothetical protein